MPAMDDQGVTYPPGPSEPTVFRGLPEPDVRRILQPYGGPRPSGDDDETVSDVAPGSLRHAHLNLVQELEGLDMNLALLEKKLIPVMGSDNVKNPDFDLDQPHSEMAEAVQTAWVRLHHLNGRLKSVLGRIDL